MTTLKPSIFTTKKGVLVTFSTTPNVLSISLGDGLCCIYTLIGRPNTYDSCAQMHSTGYWNDEHCTLRAAPGIFCMMPSYTTG
uniref:Uncharacterized protein n=1 Tax=Parascaris equorum TaxID=6256 RepID=A0A914S519_PAREQ